MNRSPLKNALIFALVVAIFAFVGVFIGQYRYLAAHQPGVTTIDVTSYPPSAAWITALLDAGKTFVFLFFLTWFIGWVYSIRNKK